MERILIVGCSGSGKSTLARTLGERLGLQVVHLDRLFWQSGWKNVSQEVFDERLSAALSEPSWVIDGNYDRTLTKRLAYCDTVIHLDYSRSVCLRGITKRVLTNRGHTRPDMAEGCPEHVDWPFLQWVWTFRRDKRPLLLQALAEAERSGVTVMRFSRRRDCRNWLGSLPCVNPDIAHTCPE